MRFEGLIFDAGDILFDASLWRRWLAEELLSLGVEITREELINKWERMLVDVYKGQADYWQRFGELLSSYRLSAEKVAELTDAAQEKAEQVENGRKVFDGVIETLAKLKEAGVKLAVLSDTESTARKVREMLRSLDIEHYFDAVITSSDIGYVKPQRQAYQAAADALGIELSRCGFVGHDLDELAGAKSAGMFAIAFNSPHKAEADTYIKHFRALENI